MLLYPEDLKEYGFCSQSYEWFVNKYGGNPVEYETAKADLMAHEAASENGKLSWINWKNGEKIEKNYDYLIKRASISVPLDEFLYREDGDIYPSEEAAMTARNLFAETLIHGIDARFNVVGYKLIFDDTYEILEVDRSKEYPEADYYRVVDRNAQEYIVYSQEESEELIENLNQRDYEEVYEKFPILQNYLFDNKYTAPKII